MMQQTINVEYYECQDWRKFVSKLRKEHPKVRAGEMSAIALKKFRKDFLDGKIKINFNNCEILEETK